MALNYLDKAAWDAGVYKDKGNDDDTQQDTSSEDSGYSASGILSAAKNFLEHPFQGMGTVIAPNYTPRPLDDSVYSDIPGTPVASGQFGELEDESVRDERMKDSADYMAANWPRLYGGFVAADEGLANVVGGIQNAVGGGNGILNNVQRAEEGMQDYRDQWNNTYGDSYFLNPNKFATDAGSVIGSSVPIMAFSGLMPGAAVAGGTRALTSALSRAGLGRLAMSKAGQALIADTVRSIPTSNLADSLSEYGTVVNDMMQNGVSEDEARRRAIPMFFKNMALDTFTVPLELGVMKGGKGIATGLLGRGAEEGIGKSLAKGAARTGMLAGASGLTEGYQEGAQNALENDVQGKRDGGWYNPFAWTNEDWEAARGGFVGGALMGIPGNVAAGFHPEAKQAPLSAESREQAQSIKDTLSHGKPKGMSNAAYNAYIELANSGNPDLIKQAASSLESFQKSQGNSSSESTDDAATEAYKDYEAYDQKQEIENFLNNNTVEQIGGEDNYNWLYGVLRNGTPEEVQKAYNDVIAAEKATAEQEAKNRPARSGGSVSPNTGNAMVNAVIQAANDSGVDPRLALAIAARESGGDDINAIHMPDPHDGIYGIMQAQDETVADLGLDSQYPDWKTDPYQNAMVGMAILKSKIANEDGDVWAGVRDYNGAGEEAEQYRQLVKNNYDNMGDIGGGGGGNATYDGLQLTLPDSDEFTDQSGNVSGLTEDTRMKLRVLDNLCYQKFGQHLIVSSSYREGDPNNHGAGVAFDVSGGIVDDPDARQWLEQAGPAVGLFVIPEYQGEAGAEFAHGDNVHFSNVEPGIYGQTRNAEGHWSEEHAAPSIQSILKGGASSGVSSKAAGDNGQFERELDQAAQEAKSDMDKIQAQSDQAMNEIMNDDSAEKTAQDAQQDAESAQKQAEESQQSAQDDVVPDVAQTIRDTSNNIDEINTLDGMFTKDGNGNDKFIDTPENRDYIKTNYKDEIDAAVKKAMQKTTAPKIKTQKKEDLPIVDGTSDVGPAARFMKSPHARLGNILADYDRNDPKFKGYMETFRHGTDEQQAQLADQLQQAQEQAKANSTTSNATVTTPSPANPSQQAVQAPKPAAQVNTPTPTQTAPKKAPKAQYEWGMRGYHWSGELNDKGKINIREADMSMYDSDMQFDVAKIQKAIAKAKTEEEARGIIRNIAKNTYGAHVERLRMKIGGNASVEEWRTKHKESPEIQEVYDDLTKGLTNLYEQATGKTLKEQFAEKAPTKAVEAPKEKPTTNNTETPKETPQKEKVEEKKGEVKHEENKGNNVNTKPQQAESKDKESSHAEEGSQSDVQEEVSKFHDLLNSKKSTPRQVVDAYKRIADAVVADAKDNPSKVKAGEKIIVDNHDLAVHSNNFTDVFIKRRLQREITAVYDNAHKELRAIIKTAGKETAPKAEQPKETKPTEQPKEKAAGGFTDDEIKTLTDSGFNRWTKKLPNGKVMDRLYIKPEYLGLELTRYKSGNISSATFNGETISNSEARRIEGTKCYVDIATKEVVCDRDDLKQAAQEVVDDALSKEKSQVLAQTETKKAVPKDDVAVTGDEFGKYKNLKELRAKAKAYYKEHLQGTSVHNPILGDVELKDDSIDFTGKGISKAVSTSAKENKLLLIKYLPQLIENANEVASQPNVKDKREAKQYTYLMTHAIVGGKQENVIVTIFTDANGNKYYNHILNDEENKKRPPVYPAQAANKSDGIPAMREPFSTSIIPQKAEKWNKPDELRNQLSDAPKVDTKYSVREANDQLTRSKEDLKAEIKEAFPTAKEIKDEGDRMTFTMPNGSHIVVDLKNEILLTDKELAQAKKDHHIDDNGNVIVEGYAQLHGKDAYMALSQGSRENTGFHEAYHLAEGAVLTDREKAAIKKAIPDAEKRADKYAKWVEARKHGRGTAWGKLFQKIKDFAMKMKKIFTGAETVNDVFRQIESGEVWERGARDNNERRYAIRQDDQEEAPVKPQDIIDAINDIVHIYEGSRLPDKERKELRESSKFAPDQKQAVRPQATDLYDRHAHAGFNRMGYFNLSNYGRILALHLDNVMNLKGNLELTNKVLDRQDKNAAENKMNGVNERLTPSQARQNAVMDFGAMMIRNPELARETYPAYAKIFDEGLEKHPDLKEKLDRVIQLNETYQGQTAAERAAGSIAREKEKVQLRKHPKEWLHTHFDKFYTNWVDDKHIFSKIVAKAEAELGRKLAYDYDVHKQAQMALNVASSRALLFLTGGKSTEDTYKVLNTVYGHAITKNVTMKDIMDALNKVSKEDVSKTGAENAYDALGNYLIAMRTEELEKHYHDAYARSAGFDEEGTREIIQNTPESIKKIAQMYWDINTNIVNILQQQGLISKDLAGKLRKYKHYCPMYRDMSDGITDMDEMIGTIGVFNKGGGYANVSNGIKRIEGGGKRPILDPITSLSQMAVSMISKCERNDVAKTFVKLGQDFSGLGDVVVRDPTLKHADPTAFAFTVWQNGEQVVYRTTPEIYDALTNNDAQANRFTIKIASGIAQTLRTGATISPSFIVRNLLRDTMSATVNSKTGFYLPLVDNVRGAWKLHFDKKFSAEYHASGASMSTYMRADADSSRDLTKELLGHKYDSYPVVVKQVRQLISWAWHKYEKFGNLIEDSTRAGEFRRARNQGLSIDQAGQLAREITLDFSRHGKKGQLVNKYVPFFNATIQGTDKFIRTFKDNPMRAIMSTVIWIILPSLGLWAINHDDDWYKELDENTKYTNWAIPLPGGTHLLIPKPQEVGILFGSGIEAVLNQMTGADPHGMKEWARQYAEAMTPSLYPAVVRPLIEWMTNYSFWTGRNLVPASLQKAPSEMQFTSYTSELAKAIGDTWIAKSIKLSPIAIDNWISGWFGSAGRFVANMLNDPISYVRGNSRPSEPAKYWYEMPVIGSFIRQNGQNSEYINRMYEIQKDMNDDYERSDAGKQRKGKKSSSNKPKELKQVDTAVSSVSKLNKEIKAIRNDPKKDPDQKRREIDQRRTKINDLAKKVVLKFDK